jgi:hypothetical protein
MVFGSIFEGTMTGRIRSLGIGIKAHQDCLSIVNFFAVILLLWLKLYGRNLNKRDQQRCNSQKLHGLILFVTD